VKNKTCSADYSPLNEESANFNPTWTKPFISTTTSNATRNKLSSAFTYRTATSLDSLSYTTEYNTYSGGGYVYDMVPTLNTTTLQRELSNLQALGWIDRNTRALFVEFSVFNPNINMFAYCTILFEYLTTGEVLVSYRFNPLKLFVSTTGFMLLALLCYIVYIVIIIFFVVKECYAWQKLGSSRYFKQFWTYAEWLLIVFSFVGLAMYAYQQYALNSILNTLLSNTNPWKSQQPVRLQNINFWTDSLLVFVGVCSFIGMLKFMRLLHFSRHIYLLFRTLRGSCKTLFYFTSTFLFVWLGFVSIILAMYNSSNNTVNRSFLSILETTFLMLLHKFHTQAFIDTQPIVGPIIFIAFNLIITLLMAYCVVVIITKSYEKAKVEYELENRDDSSLMLWYVTLKYEEIIKRMARVKHSDTVNEEKADAIELFKRKTTQVVNVVHDYKEVMDDFNDANSSVEKNQQQEKHTVNTDQVLYQFNAAGVIEKKEGSFVSDKKQNSFVIEKKLNSLADESKQPSFVTMKQMVIDIEEMSNTKEVKDNKVVKNLKEKEKKGKNDL
jgi:hypothetical protein